MRCRLFPALVVVLTPALAIAQGPPPAPQSAGAAIGLPLAPIAPTLPQIGLPLPPIGLPLPPLGLSPVPNPSRIADDRSHGRPPDRGMPGGHKRRGPGAAVVYVAPYFWSNDVPGAPTPGTIVPDEAPAPQPAPTGGLRLDLQPASGLQVFVDDAYVGTSDEVGGELALEAGTHRIEISGPGYAPLIFNARIVAQRTITYRQALTPLEPAPLPDAPRPPEPPKGERQTFYLIPGCYLGNVPPEQVRLPAGCDARRVITHQP